MYFLKNNRYKIISKILFFVLILEPVLMVPFAKPTFAQSNNSGFNQSFANYDGISQWGNLDVINNPAIGNALRSCLQVVPSFTKKINKVFGGTSAASSTALLNSSRADELKSFCSSNSDAKWATGTRDGYGSAADGYVTGGDIQRCIDQQDAASGFSREISNISSSIGDVQRTEDAQAIARLDDLIKDQDALQRQVSATQKEAQKTNTILNENKVRNECMDSIAYSMTKTLLAGVTEGTVNLINTGNFGDPFFVKDTKTYFEDLDKLSLKQVFGGLLDEASKNNDQYPFLRATYRNLVEQNTPAPFQDRARFTLEQILSGQPYNKDTDPALTSGPIASGRGSFVNAFRNDFSVGGWNGWLALTQLPQNNPIGFAIIAQEELSRSQTVAKDQAKSELEQSGGFLSMRKCVEERISPSFDTVTGKMTGGGIKTRGIKIGPNDPACIKSEVTTPGAVLASRLDAVITSDVRQLELADQFNESLNLIFTAAFNKLTSEGLSALSNKVYGSWAAQTQRTSFIERYNSTISAGGTGGGPSNIGTAELIYRRVESSYSSYDFDITTDLFDQQVGCTIRPGILTTEKNYLRELERSNNKNISPLYKFMPAMAELDFCIPGPTTNWEEISDEKYAHLVSQITENGIGFQTEPTAPGSFYSDIGKQIGDILKKKANADLAQAITVSSVRTFGAIVAATPFPPFTQLAGVLIVIGAEIGNLITNIARKKKIAEDQALIDMLNRAQSVMPRAIENAWTREGDEWGLLQLKYLNADYQDYKVAIYDKFSDANNIPVAKVARPFVRDLPSYAQNLFTIQQDYDEEIALEKQVIDELQIIHDRVKVIKDEAIAEAVRRGLPTDVPAECKPAPSQCPARLPGSSYLLNTTPVLYATLQTNAAYAASVASTATSYAGNSRTNVGSLVNQAQTGQGSGVQQSLESYLKTAFPDPSVSLNSFVALPKVKSGSSTFEVEYFDIILNLNSSVDTLSVIVDIPSAGISEQVYGQPSLRYSKIHPNDLKDKTITIKGYNAMGKEVVSSCTVKVFGITATCN